MSANSTKAMVQQPRRMSCILAPFLRRNTRRSKSAHERVPEDDIPKSKNIFRYEKFSNENPTRSPNAHSELTSETLSKKLSKWWRPSSNAADTTGIESDSRKFVDEARRRQSVVGVVLPMTESERSSRIRGSSMPPVERRNLHKCTCANNKATQNVVTDRRIADLKNSEQSSIMERYKTRILRRSLDDSAYHAAVNSRSRGQNRSAPSDGLCQRRVQQQVSNLTVNHNNGKLDSESLRPGRVQTNSAAEMKAIRPNNGCSKFHPAEREKLTMYHVIPHASLQTQQIELPKNIDNSTRLAEHNKAEHNTLYAVDLEKLVLYPINQTVCRNCAGRNGKDSPSSTGLPVTHTIKLPHHTGSFVMANGKTYNEANSRMQPSCVRKSMLLDTNRMHMNNAGCSHRKPQEWTQTQRCITWNPLAIDNHQLNRHSHPNRQMKDVPFCLSNRPPDRNQMDDIWKYANGSRRNRTGDTNFVKLDCTKSQPISQNHGKSSSLYNTDARISPHSQSMDNQRVTCPHNQNNPGNRIQTPFTEIVNPICTAANVRQQMNNRSQGCPESTNRSMVTGRSSEINTPSAPGHPTSHQLRPYTNFKSQPARVIDRNGFIFQWVPREN